MCTVNRRGADRGPRVHRASYEKYNAVLRFFSAKNPDDGKVRVTYASAKDPPFLQKKCGWLHLGEWKPDGDGVRWEWLNTYTTTIHALNSVIVKLLRLTKIRPLFRGWTGATLPKSFFAADAMGVPPPSAPPCR